MPATKLDQIYVNFDPNQHKIGPISAQFCVKVLNILAQPTASENDQTPSDLCIGFCNNLKQM